MSDDGFDRFSVQLADGRWLTLDVRDAGNADGSLVVRRAVLDGEHVPIYVLDGA